MLLVVFVAGSVSAFWPFSESITGNVVRDEFLEDGVKCTDYDKGTFIEEASGTYLIGRWRNTVKYDYCSGKPRTIYFLGENNTIRKVTGKTTINEYYCNGDSREKEKFSSESLDEKGICVTEAIEKDSLDEKIPRKNRKGAKWLTAEPFCLEVGEGKVRDETGRLYRAGCTGKTYVEYSCDKAGTEVVETPTVCTTQCSVRKGGCFGTCSGETDVENDKDVAGSLMLDGEEILDKCSLEGKGVKQYACKNNSFKTMAPVRCGSNRICMDSEEGAYCKDLYASADSGLTEDDVIQIIGDSTTGTGGLDKRGVLDILNGCRSYESETSDTQSCNDICSNESKTCIKEDVVVFDGTISKWVVDTGAECGTSYSGLNNTNEFPGMKLQCLCC